MKMQSIQNLLKMLILGLDDKVNGTGTKVRFVLFYFLS